jgi:hypothetical protein
VASRGEPARRSAPSVAISISVGVAIALVLLVGVPFIVRPVTSCTLGSEVGSAWIWTPQILVNVPDGGSGSWDTNGGNWTFTSGSVVMGKVPLGGTASLSPGVNETGIVGVVGLAHWGFFATHNISTGFGTDDPCTQPYVAGLEAPLMCGGSGNLTTILPLANNSSDANELHVVPAQPCSVQSATPGAEISFDTSYHASNMSGNHQSETIALCGPLSSAPLNVSLTGIAKYPIEATMLLPSGPILASGFETWQGPLPPLGPTVGYSLPPGWTWNVSTVIPGVLPTLSNPLTTSLLAFERSDC